MRNTDNERIKVNEMTKLVNMAIEAYIKVYGAEKWDSLTAQEQHDVIMTAVKMLNAAI